MNPEPQPAAGAPAEGGSEAAPEPEGKAALYAARVQRFVASAHRLESRFRLVSNLRGLSFAIAVFAAIGAFLAESPLILLCICVLAAIIFVVLVVVHGKVTEARDDALRWAQVNRTAEQRCRGEWRKFPDDGSHYLEQQAGAGYLVDLDVLGQGSLFQRICVAHTRFGQDGLVAALSKPAPLELICARQEAVQALMPLLDLRQQLEALALAVVDPPADQGEPRPKRSPRPHAPDPEPLLRWAESAPRLLSHPWTVRFAWILPALTLSGMLLGLPWWSWSASLLGQLLLVAITRRATSEVFAAVSATEGAFLRYGAMLELLENLDVRASLLLDAKRQLLSGESRPSVAMKDFRNGVGWFDLRHNGLVHPFADLFLCWDIHCVVRLERWQQRAGHAVRGWFQALGELEVLSCFAGLAADERGFCFPEVTTGDARFEARGLGHPLIDPGRRVSNDVVIPRPGTALLVTGSNMSGKSTLLRAMGLAGVLGLAGAPVCAVRVRMSWMGVHTSIRVSDSLDRGVSHFYAELRQLKSVLDAADGAHSVLFLLDEILHGTNSRERQIGARWILAELLRRGAIGAVSTHDMGLAQLPPELEDRMQLVHFRESLQSGKMTFDYRLREGPVMAGNALRLMRLVGLEVPLE